jgi:hypothetical protein
VTVPGAVSICSTTSVSGTAKGLPQLEQKASPSLPTKPQTLQFNSDSPKRYDQFLKVKSEAVPPFI